MQSEKANKRVVSRISSYLAVSIILLLVGFGSFKAVQTTQSVNKAEAMGLPGTQAPVPAGQPEDFSGKITHFQTQVTFGTTASSKVTDVWVKVGPGNQPLLQRATTTLNGAFDQASFYNFTTGQRTFLTNTPFPYEASRAPAAGGPGKACTSAGAVAPAVLTKLKALALPLYVGTSNLTAAGFAPNAVSSFGSPQVQDAKPHGSPAATKGAGPTKEVTRASARQDGAPEQVTVKYDEATGLVLAWSTKSGQGSSSDYREVRTPVEIFDAVKVPDSFFDPNQFAGACN